MHTLYMAQKRSAPPNSLCPPSPGNLASKRRKAMLDRSAMALNAGAESELEIKNKQCSMCQLPI